MKNLCVCSMCHPSFHGCHSGVGREVCWCNKNCGITNSDQDVWSWCCVPFVFFPFLPVGIVSSAVPHACLFFSQLFCLIVLKQMKTATTVTWPFLVRFLVRSSAIAAAVQHRRFKSCVFVPCVIPVSREWLVEYFGGGVTPFEVNKKGRPFVMYELRIMHGVHAGKLYTEHLVARILLMRTVCQVVL